MRELDKHRDELKELEEMIVAGADPAQLSTWKSPVELNMPQPTRGQVILWERALRGDRVGPGYRAGRLCRQRTDERPEDEQVPHVL